MKFIGERVVKEQVDEYQIFWFFTYVKELQTKLNQDTQYLKQGLLKQNKI